jgi:hypothetical protein
LTVSSPIPELLLLNFILLYFLKARDYSTQWKIYGNLMEKSLINFYLFVNLFICLDRVFLYSLGRIWTCSPPALASWVLTQSPHPAERSKFLKKVLPANSFFWCFSGVNEGGSGFWASVLPQMWGIPWSYPFIHVLL